MRYFAKFCSRCSAKLHSAISLTTRQTSSELGLLSLLCEIAFRDFAHDSTDFKRAWSALAALRNSDGVIE